MMDTCHTFFQSHIICNTKSDHSVNYGLWVIMLCQCSFINCENYTTQVVEVDNKGGYAHGGGEQGVYEKSLCLLLNFAVNLKLL